MLQINQGPAVEPNPLFALTSSATQNWNLCADALLGFGAAADLDAWLAAHAPAAGNDPLSQG
ncbi:MAG: hypothetical protein HC893_13680 [Chloroflexaceae bacterium]|nr:hypothetical protein [Chloroflexaceae bacterium]NJL34703.1 hypothetical protein [Chloroflexaceae bacterium]NJO04653.1 hypothetical protein [Chloroflexaceae bacterium]